MRLPRNLGSDDLIILLRRYGYEVTRQTGSHIRLTTAWNGPHHVTIPHHKPLRIGTLQSILKDIASHLQIDWSTFLSSLLGS